MVHLTRLHYCKLIFVLATFSLFTVGFQAQAGSRLPLDRKFLQELQDDLGFDPTIFQEEAGSVETFYVNGLYRNCFVGICGPVRDAWRGGSRASPEQRYDFEHRERMGDTYYYGNGQRQRDPGDRAYQQWYREEERSRMQYEMERRY